MKLSSFPVMFLSALFVSLAPTICRAECHSEVIPDYAGLSCLVVFEDGQSEVLPLDTPESVEACLRFCGSQSTFEDSSDAWETKSEFGNETRPSHIAIP